MLPHPPSADRSVPTAQRAVGRLAVDAQHVGVGVHLGEVDERGRVEVEGGPGGQGVDDGAGDEQRGVLLGLVRVGDGAAGVADVAGGADSGKWAVMLWILGGSCGVVLQAWRRRFTNCHRRRACQTHLFARRMTSF